jgi:hypothetical protein
MFLYLYTSITKIVAQGYGCSAYGESSYGSCGAAGSSAETGGSLINTGSVLAIVISIALIFIAAALIIKFLGKKKQR